MDPSELIIAQIRALEPEPSASQIVAYFRFEEMENQHLIRLAFGHQSLMQAFLEKAKLDLGLLCNGFPPKPINVHEVSQFSPTHGFLQLSRNPYLLLSPSLFVNTHFNSVSKEIWVTFLPESSVTEEDIWSYFRQFGAVKKIRVPYGKKRKLAFVTFVTVDTVRAVLAREKHSIRGSDVDLQPLTNGWRQQQKQQRNQMKQGMNYSIVAGLSGLFQFAEETNVEITLPESLFDFDAPKSSGDSKDASSSGYSI